MSSKEIRFFNRRIEEIIKNYTKLDIYFTYMNQVSELFFEEKKLKDIHEHLNETKKFIEQINYKNMKDFYSDFVPFVQFFITIYEEKYYIKIIEFLLEFLKLINKSKYENMFFINESNCILNIKESKRSRFCNLREKKIYKDILSKISKINKELLQNLKKNNPSNGSPLDNLLEQMVDINYVQKNKKGIYLKDDSFFNIFLNILIPRITKILTDMPLLIKDLLKDNIKEIEDEKLKEKYKVLSEIFMLVTKQYNDYVDSKNDELCYLFKTIYKKSHCKKRGSKIQCTKFNLLIKPFCEPSSRNDTKSEDRGTKIKNIKLIVKKSLGYNSTQENTTYELINNNSNSGISIRGSNNSNRTNQRQNGPVYAVVNKTRKRTKPRAPQPLPRPAHTYKPRPLPRPAHTYKPRPRPRTKKLNMPSARRTRTPSARRTRTATARSARSARSTRTATARSARSARTATARSARTPSATARRLTARNTVYINDPYSTPTNSNSSNILTQSNSIDPSYLRYRETEV